MMNVSLPILQMFGLVMASILAGGGLTMLGIGGLAHLGRDSAARGCAGIGTVLLVAASYLAVLALMG
jgi:hypothetical protein